MVLPKQRKCCVPYCSFEGIHQFPSNFERRNAWIDALSTDNWSPVASVSKVCTQHFTPDDYVIPKNGSLGKAARVLKPNAVPTQNIWSKQASSVAAAREMAKKRKMSSNSVSAKRPRPSGSGLNNFGAVMRQEENASVLPSNLSVVSQHTNPQRVQNTNVERGWMMEILPDDEPDYPEIKEEEEIKIEDDDVILAEDPLAIHPQDILLEKRKSPLSMSIPEDQWNELDVKMETSSVLQETPQPTVQVSGIFPDNEGISSDIAEDGDVSVIPWVSGGLCDEDSPEASVQTPNDIDNEETLTTASLHPQNQEISSVTVNKLKQLNFSQLSLQGKVTIKKKGRPTPDIQMFQPFMRNKKKYARSFNPVWYQRKKWLCGCEVKNALFCFPCLLFGGDVTWTENGFTNINRMKEKVDNHEKSKKHVDNVVSLSLLGTANIKEVFSEAYRLSINEHNNKVKKNREILSKIIDCIFFRGNFETPLHGLSEEEDSVNSGILGGLIHFASKLDSDLKNHLETSTAFKYVSKTIQNEILDCLLQIYREQIKMEITKASFVAVIAEDTTDVSEQTQTVIILRYVLDGEIFERFWGFFNPENGTADGIAKCILEQLDIILQRSGKKLIAQTFDGGNVMKGKKLEVQAKIKAVYSNAHFIHCYTHQLDVIMRNAASITLNSRIFFSNLLAIPKFFSRSPQHVSTLKKHMDVDTPYPSSLTWNFSPWTIKKIHENVKPLKDCFTEIQSTSNADQTIAEATGILKYLNDDNFMFWLELFHQIMPHVEIIYSQMQSQKISVLQVNEYLKGFETDILKIRNSKYCENPSKTLMAEAKKVCDCIYVDIMDRYSSITHLIAAKLFNKKNFTSFKNEMPTEDIALTSEAYPMIDKKKLETELKVFYFRSDIHEYCKLNELLQFILKINLDDGLSEITKLIKILLTIPMTTSEADRCFSTLKRIKAFLRSTRNSERLNALAVLSVEKKFLNSHPHIKGKIMDLFAKTTARRMDFSFK